MTAYIPLGDWCERLSKKLSDELSEGKRIWLLKDICLCIIR